MSEVRRHPEHLDLLDKTRDRPFGEVITHEEIEQVTKLNRTDNRYRSMLQKWKREMLREANKPVIAIAGTGYRILNLDEIPGRAKHVVRLGIKGMSRGAAIVKHAPFDKMTDADRSAAVNIGARLGILVQMAREHVRDIKALPVKASTPRVLK